MFDFNLLSSLIKNLPVNNLKKGYDKTEHPSKPSRLKNMPTRVVFRKIVQKQLFCHMTSQMSQMAVFSVIYISQKQSEKKFY